MLRDPLPEWNRTEVDYPRHSTIADLFRQQAALTPEAIAVIYKERQLTYRELDERSTRLACYLQSLGVKAETLVGLCLRRSEKLVVSLLAILKAGGAYVPLDPHHPKERLAYVLDDSGMAVVLASAETRALLPFDRPGVAVVDFERAEAEGEVHQSAGNLATSCNLAYVMYTSGSTGNPKGVMVEHHNVVNFFTGMDGAIGKGPGVWLAVTSFAFDISVLELLWTLTRGFTVVVDGHEGPASMADEIRRHHVTHLQMTPSLARMLTLDSHAFASLVGLKKILLGGETLPADLVRHIQQVFTGGMYNMYGPTETTIWSTAYRVEEPGISVSIGRPIANTRVYLVDENLMPVKVGATGELLIGGEGVARGYLRRTELTAERFIAAPALSTGRLYRTGDLARIATDGNIEFLGRADYQVKLRGHRIELGEVEAALERCTGVSQAVVVVREDRADDKRLVAYIVAERSISIESEALRSALDKKLPEVMVPSSYVFLSALPLTENGKIDRNALLKLPAPGGPNPSERNNKVVGELSEMERTVATVWQEALGTPAVGLDDNFFDLGAHSLTVAEVQAKLQSTLGREVSLVDLFQFTTVHTLASHLAATESSDAISQVSARAQRRRLARQD